MTDDLKAKAIALQHSLVEAGIVALQTKAAVSPADYSALVRAAAESAQAAVALHSIINPPVGG